jgi:hypothetical protein
MSFNRLLESCRLMEKYKPVPTDEKVTMSDSEAEVKPLLTLTDEFGGCAQIIDDDHCYVLLLKQKDGTYKATTHIFPEAFEAMKQLSGPVPA